VQIIIDASTKQMLIIRFCKGSKHDFALFKENHPQLNERTWIVADSGYQGLQDQHPLVYLPTKKSKHHPLTEEQKQSNKALASFRVRVEHVIRSLKIWRIFKGPYRNRRKRLHLRLSLIAAIYNFQLGF